MPATYAIRELRYIAIDAIITYAIGYALCYIYAIH